MACYVFPMLNWRSRLLFVTFCGNGRNPFSSGVSSVTVVDTDEAIEQHHGVASNVTASNGVAAKEGSER
jgi:hypothetical protein